MYVVLVRGRVTILVVCSWSVLLFVFCVICSCSWYRPCSCSLFSVRALVLCSCCVILFLVCVLVPGCVFVIVLVLVMCPCSCYL